MRWCLDDDLASEFKLCRVDSSFRLQSLFFLAASLLFQLVLFAWSIGLEKSETPDWDNKSLGVFGSLDDRRACRQKMPPKTGKYL
jgi:hypothetical protein